MIGLLALPPEQPRWPRSLTEIEPWAPWSPVRGSMVVRPSKAIEAVRIRVSQPALVPDLVEFLGRAFCTTQSVRGSIVEVVLPSVADGAKARRDLDLYLAAWRGLHPPVEATVIDVDQAGSPATPA